MSSFLWIPLLLSLGTALAFSAEKPFEREFITDRPDRTEAAYSVEPGRVQIETDLVSLIQDGDEKTWIFNWMNLKTGLTPSSDLQLVIQSLTSTSEKTGLGDTTIRYKHNLFGNDSGDVALALMPYLNRGDSSWTGGLMIPLSMNAPHGYFVGAMFQLDRVRNSSDRGFHSQFISSVTIGHDLFWGLEGYVEFFSQIENALGAPWVATFDGGLILPVGHHLRFDLGANVGVTEAAPDFNPFLGLSAKF